MSQVAVAPEGFVVIGAGLPRTGTNSLKVALEQLLGGTCCHMNEITKNANVPFHMDFWTKAMRRRLTKEDWQHYLNVEGNYRSGIDYPISFYYKELLEIFPDAKVVMSDRAPETWYKSVKDTVQVFCDDIKDFPVSWYRKATGQDRAGEVAYDVCYAIPEGFDDSVLSSVRKGPAQAEKFYRQWVDTVKRTVPPKRLLIHNAKEGWEPLCKFLGVPVPANPYPRVNDTQEFKNRNRSRKVKSYVMITLIPFLVGGLAYGSKYLAAIM